jgi:hypothetical protein
LENDQLERVIRGYKQLLLGEEPEAGNAEQSFSDGVTFPEQQGPRRPSKTPTWRDLTGILNDLLYSLLSLFRKAAYFFLIENAQ